MARYERIVSGAPIEIKTYSIAYENDVPKSATVTVTYPSKDAEEAAGAEGNPAADSHTYELVLHTDDEGNVVAAESDGRRMATMPLRCTGATVVPQYSRWHIEQYASM